MGSRDEVDRDRIFLARNGEGRSLTRPAHELLQVGTSNSAHVEPGEECIGEMDDPKTEAIFARRATRSTSPEAASVPS